MVLINVSDIKEEELPKSDQLPNGGIKYYIKLSDGRFVYVKVRKNKYGIVSHHAKSFCVKKIVHACRTLNETQSTE